MNFELHDATTAIRYFERALALDPQSTQIKLAYADANFKRDEFEKIQLKGKLQKITVYEVTGLKDRWRDPAVIPPAIAETVCREQNRTLKFRRIWCWPWKALDGSIGHCRVVALLSYALADRLKLNEEIEEDNSVGRLPPGSWEGSGAPPRSEPRGQLD